MDEFWLPYDGREVVVTSGLLYPDLPLRWLSGASDHHFAGSVVFACMLCFPRKKKKQGKNEDRRQ